MRIDLYTDAGVKEGVATWAVVAIVSGSAEPAFEASGRLRADTHCTATAELRAIANAIHRLVRSGHAEPGSLVRVFTDSRHAADRIAGRHRKKPEHSAAKAAFVIAKQAEVHSLVVQSVWIKGHRPDAADVHARWNNRCDALCRAARSKPRPTKARKLLGIARKLSGAGDRPFAPIDATPLARERVKTGRSG